MVILLELLNCLKILTVKLMQAFFLSGTKQQQFSNITIWQ